MKYALWIWISIVLSLCGCVNSTSHSKVAKIRKNDPDTKLKSEYYAYTDSKGREIKDGPYKLWYPSGAKYVEGSYSNDKEDGKWVVLSEDGKVKLIGWYREGKPWDGDFYFGHEIRKYLAGKLLAIRSGS